MDFEVSERRVLARLARQRVLNRPNPLQYHVIIDESILTRPIGTPSVLRGQLARLVDAAQSEHITSQVLPLSGRRNASGERPLLRSRAAGTDSRLRLRGKP
jgi:hypothetical protein